MVNEVRRIKLVHVVLKALRFFKSNVFFSRKNYFKNELLKNLINVNVKVNK